MERKIFLRSPSGKTLFYLFSVLVYFGIMPFINTFKGFLEYGIFDVKYLFLSMLILIIPSSIGKILFVYGGFIIWMLLVYYYLYPVIYLWRVKDDKRS